MTTVVAGVNPTDGLDLVVVHAGRAVEVWPTASVHGEPSTMAPDRRKLVAVGHRDIVGVAASPHAIGRHRPVLLADRNGLVSMWQTFGIRLNDPLPPDPNHHDVISIAVVPADGDDFTVVTASHADRNLRLWQPSSDAVTFIDLDVAPSCVLHASGILVIGHEQGLIGLSIRDTHFA